MFTLCGLTPNSEQVKERCFNFNAFFMPSQKSSNFISALSSIGQLDNEYESQNSTSTKLPPKRGNHYKKYKHVLDKNQEHLGRSAHTKDDYKIPIGHNSTSKLSSHELVTPDPSAYGEEEYEAQQDDYGHIGNRAMDNNDDA